MRPALPSAAGPILGLDVLRATAILLVLICHWAGHFGYWLGIAIPPAIEALGDTGVAIFFALSGFLIGRILIAIGERRPGWRDFATFLLRRALRTLPLYFLWLGLLFAAFPPQAEALAVGMRFLTLTQNLLAEMPADYYFAVSWSLAIEEWFYLLFGGAFLAAARWLGARRAARLVLPLFLLLPPLARLIHGDPPSLVPFRLDEIAYGVLIAHLAHAGSPLLRHPVASLLAGLALIATAVSGLLPHALAPNTLVAGGALLLPAALRLRHAPRWLAATIGWIAGRSYALYLVHLTVLTDMVERGLWEPGWLSTPACIALAVVGPAVLAELSWRLLEQPILHLRPGQHGHPGGAPIGIEIALP